MKNGLIIDSHGMKCWYKNNLLHNENGPALESRFGNRSWWINGKLHRLDGPAIEGLNGQKYWYYEDKLIDCNSQEEFERYLKRLVLL